MLTLAAVPVLCPDREIMDALEARIALAGFLPWMAAGPTADLQLTAAPQAARAFPPVRFNRFTWPRDAGRCAVGYFLLDAAGALKVQAAAEPGGGDGDPEGDGDAGAPGDDAEPAGPPAAAPGPTPIPLFIGFPPAEGEEDESAPPREDLTTDVVVLRWLPLARLAVAAPAGDEGGNAAGAGAASAADAILRNCYLCMVVDDRWRWNQVACPDFAIGPDASPAVTWAACFAAVAGALGIDLPMAAVPAAYLSPDESLNLAGQPAGMVLDALARNVGCRVSRDYDGTVRCLTYAAALALRQADEDGHPDRPLQGGGDGLDEESGQ